MSRNSPVSLPFLPLRSLRSERILGFKGRTERQSLLLAFLACTSSLTFYLFG